MLKNTVKKGGRGMKRETVKKFFEFLEKKEGKENIESKLIFSPESIPEGFVVKGILNLEELPIKSLPKGLKVEGNLWLSDTPIKSLPEGLEVGGVLWLYNTPIQSLPEGLKVGGTLCLSEASIQSLPEGLEVGGSLELGETPLSRKYTKEEIRKMIEDRGGHVKGEIYL